MKKKSTVKKPKATKRRSVRSQLFPYKGNRCSHCGKTVARLRREYSDIDGYFQFNHTDPKKKAKNYDNIIRRRRISSEVLDEVDKCVLLCVGCHTILHGQGI